MTKLEGGLPQDRQGPHGRDGVTNCFCGVDAIQIKGKKLGQGISVKSLKRSSL